ncbi:hypothetical protein M427DRAFT_34946 [Gonapodya prolifera JEL478]|uniref:Uncharacterized protein n=1 Tax=Gonapodya prolifera (strain JEL478) TaxID=1344416 RepID=A0A139A5Z8_GONPJ|nr:hypothetical protein M427DRAFT_34946 [Gonapodya prolifera JEL478]|eukprot:KXS12217.1 hypothetical protein M427DRAFT_34946 [Gonapodya prolifera JEL478]
MSGLGTALLPLRVSAAWTKDGIRGTYQQQRRLRRGQSADRWIAWMRSPAHVDASADGPGSLFGAWGRRSYRCMHAGCVVERRDALGCFLAGTARVVVDSVWGTVVTVLLVGCSLGDGSPLGSLANGSR